MPLHIIESRKAPSTQKGSMTGTRTQEAAFSCGVIRAETQPPSAGQLCACRIRGGAVACDPVCPHALPLDGGQSSPKLQPLSPSPLYSFPLLPCCFLQGNTGNPQREDRASSAGAVLQNPSRSTLRMHVMCCVKQAICRGQQLAVHKHIMQVCFRITVVKSFLLIKVLRVHFFS